MYLLFLLGFGAVAGPGFGQEQAATGHGSGGIITRAQIDAARQAYAAKHGAPSIPAGTYATDVSDLSSVDPEVFAREGVHVLLAFPSTGAYVAWNDALIQDAARVLLEQREEVWQENGAEAPVPLTILYTYHDYAGSGKLNEDNVDLYRESGSRSPSSDNPHPLHAFRKDVGADFLYVVVPTSRPEDGTNWRYYGWQNIFLPQQPSSELISLTGGVLWSDAIEAAALQGWSQLILAHEMDGHGMGGCFHINGVAGTDLMRSSTPWGPRMTECAAASFANAAYVAANWPGAMAFPVAVEEGAEVPDGIRLLQNYPNPFNPSTEITFTLPEATSVRLVVFDLLGKEVETLVDGMRPAGSHTVRFEADGLPSGLYLYRLIVGEQVQTRRMVLLR